MPALGDKREPCGASTADEKAQQLLSKYNVPHSLDCRCAVT